MKKIAVVGTVGIPASYGGFETLVENLTKYGSDKYQYTVFCSRKNYKGKLKNYNNADLVYLPFNANGVQSVIYDIYSLIYCLISRPDVVLILGVSGCVFLPFYKLLSSSKVVTNIDGLEWKRDKWGKFAKWFLKWSESLAVKYSDSVIADNQAISDYVNSEYSKESHTIAYGGDHALLKDVSCTQKGEEDYCLSICRIEPENNIRLILEAFSKSKRKIKFIGNWNLSPFGLELKNKFNGYKNIELIDPIYDLEVLYEMRSKSLFYIHGHSAGGTNPSLVEMMHFGKPIVAYDCNFNRYSTENKAIYFSDVETLISILNSDCVQFNKNGYYMREIAEKKYRWSNIVNNYESLYN